jgi:hypothetical protein
VLDVTRKRGKGKLRRGEEIRREDFGGSRVTFACQGGEVFSQVTWKVDVEASRVCSLRLLWCFRERSVLPQFGMVSLRIR